MIGSDHDFYRLLRHLANFGYVRRPAKDDVPEEAYVDLCERALRDGVPEPTDLEFKELWTWWIASMRLHSDLDLVSFEPSEDDPGVYQVKLKFRAGTEHVHNMAKKDIKERGLRALLADLEREVAVQRWSGGDDDGRSYADEDPGLENSRLLTEYTLGFRVWSVDSRGNLGPQNGRPAGSVWDYGREVRAECSKNEPHPAPQRNCACGLHAYSRAHMAFGSHFRASASQVIGAVAARGVLVPHDDGFRAEFMRPVVLAYDPGDQALGPRPFTMKFYGRETFLDQSGNEAVFESAHEERVKRLAARIGIPAVPYEQLEAAALEFGALIPDEFLEWPKDVPRD